MSVCMHGFRQASDVFVEDQWRPFLISTALCLNKLCTTGLEIAIDVHTVDSMLGSKLECRILSLV